MLRLRWQPTVLHEAVLAVSSILHHHPATRCMTDTDNYKAAFPLFGIQLYHKLGDQWATSLLAFLTVAMMPFPIIFFKYGKKIRGKSRFATA
jgi:hypothetical protein